MMNTEQEQTQTATAPPDKSAKTIRTTLYRYHFNLTDPAGWTAWEKLEAELEAKGLERFHTWGGKEPPPMKQGVTAEQVEIETAFIFDNQWNTTTERVFDWFQQYELIGRQCARGHYLDITPEMQAARLQTVKCGYCGKQYGRNVAQLSFEPLFDREPGDGFCHACLDSPYLKETDLWMLRLLPLAGNQDRPRTGPTPELLAEYVNRQTTGADSRAAKRRESQRQNVLDKAEKEIENANTERDGMLWLWEHGCDLDNVIYYSHTQKFSFGWRSPLSKSVASKMLDLLCEFPFAYELKREE